ncbi:short-chain dehydrogenase/reductase [Apiospora arundinis]
MAAITDIQKDLGPDRGGGMPIGFLELSLTPARKAVVPRHPDAERGRYVQPVRLIAGDYELQGGTNHMGHALPTKLLRTLLLETMAELMVREYSDKNKDNKPGDIHVVVLSPAVNGRIMRPLTHVLPFQTPDWREKRRRERRILLRRGWRGCAERHGQRRRLGEAAVGVD